MKLSRDAILSAKDRKTVEVEVPEWGGSVNVRSLSAADRNEITGFMFKNKDTNPTSYRLMMVLLAVVDDDGKRIFEDGDLIALGEKSPTAIDRICDEIEQLNLLHAEAVEEAVKK